MFTVMFWRTKQEARVVNLDNWESGIGAHKTEFEPLSCDVPLFSTVEEGWKWMEDNLSLILSCTVREWYWENEQVEQDLADMAPAEYDEWVAAHEKEERRLSNMFDTMTDEEYNPVDLPIKVCMSNAGYYIGQMEPGGCPFSRLSGYYLTEKKAVQALSGWWEERYCVENVQLLDDLIRIGRLVRYVDSYGVVVNSIGE